MPTSRVRSTVRPLAVATALVIALSGCSSSDEQTGSGPAEPAIGDIAVLLDSASIRFPLDAYVPTGAQRKALAEAQDVLVDQCMKRYGYRFAVRKSHSGSGDNSMRYGVSSLQTVDRYGYENPEIAERPRKPPEKPMGPNEKLILHGETEVDPSKPVPMSQEEAESSGQGVITVAGKKVPAGGCLREGFLKLYAPTKDSVDIMVPQNFGFDAYGRSRQDSRVRKAVEAWSACMAKEGHRTDNPVSPQNDLGFGDTTLNSPKAVTAARQDVTCKKQTNLIGIWSTVEIAYQKRLIEQNAETLATAKTQLDTRLRLAAQLTS
ncbi:hypothetical protein ACFXGT_03650 [Streptomyces sp. NPDC059352]|uniref:hypothetical protein n=1 Tax=Streptomyces sp. NPDC059352 TaxID=3346810 RepID=UPI0036B7F016